MTCCKNMREWDQCEIQQAGMRMGIHHFKCGGSIPIEQAAPQQYQIDRYGKTWPPNAYELIYLPAAINALMFQEIFRMVRGTSREPIPLREEETDLSKT